MSLLHRLVLLVVLALFPAAAIQVYNEVDLRRGREADLHQQARYLLDLVEADQLRVIEGIRQTMLTLRQTPMVRDGDVAGCRDFMARLDRDLPDYIDIYVTDRNGTIHCGTETAALGGNIADRFHFQEAMRTGDFVVGTYIQRRLTGKPALSFAMPFHDAAGNPAGIVTALLAVDWLESNLTAKTFPRNTAAIVADRDGTVLARTPTLPGLVGHPLPEHYGALLAAGEHGSRELTALDGLPRILAYSPRDAGSKGIFIGVGLDKAAAVAPINEALLRSLGMFGAGLALLLAGTALGGHFLLRRPVAALVDATRRWRAGDYSARTVLGGASEIAVLGRAFNALADDLEEQVRQRARIEQDLRKTNSLLAGVLEHLPVGVGVIDANGMAGRMNAAAARIWGSEQPVALDQYGRYKGWWADTGKPVEAHEWAGARAITRGETSLGEIIEIEAFDGARKTIRNSAVPMRDDEGRIVGAVVMSEDITEQRAAEQALRISEIRHRSVVETAVDAMIIIDEQGAIQSFNRAAEQIFGWQADEVIGRNVRLLMPEPFRDNHDGYLRHHLTSGECKIIGIGREVEGLRQDGTLIPLELRIAEWQAGGRRFFTGILRDIRRRLETERRLRENLALLDTILESSPDPIFVKDVEGRYVVANSSTAFAHGKTRDDLIGVPEQDLLSFEDGPAVRDADRRIMQAGRAETVDETLFSRGHREPRHYLSTKTPLHDEAGRVVGIIGISRDITALKSIETALRASEARYRGLVETQADLIVRIGADGRFTFVNDTACRIFGHPLEDILDSEWTRFVHPDDAGAVMAAIERARTTPDRRATAETRIQTTDALRWYAWEGYAILDEAGRFIENQSVGRDITERKAMEDALRRAKEEAELANLAKSKFLAAASHDLRQPMQSLFLFAAALASHVHSERGQNTLALLERGLETLKALLDSLLDVSRLDAGAIQPEIGDVPLNVLIRDIEGAYVPVAHSKGILLTADTSCEAEVRTDPMLLGRMIRNLVENAIRYTKAGEIRIGCHPAGDSVRIEVSDTGIGIPREQLDQIFEEFHQVGNPERDRNQGLGLGLAIVRRLSGILGHPVEVRSELGKGSSFSITVPISTATAAPAVAPCAPMPIGKPGRTVLIVDDDAMLLAALRVMLEGWNYEVMPAGSGDEALEQVRAPGRVPDVVIADYRLRNGEIGTQVVQRIRQAVGRTVPGIILTGETGPEHQREASGLDLGLAHKPVTPRQLHAAIEARLRAAALPEPEGPDGLVTSLEDEPGVR